MKLYVAAILALFLVAPVSGQSTGSAGKPKSTAELAFERLKSIEGDWDGRSTKGWEDTNTFEVIAGGSVPVSAGVEAGRWRFWRSISVLIGRHSLFAAP